jgi:hypothetical protein
MFGEEGKTVREDSEGGLNAARGRNPLKTLIHHGNESRSKRHQRDDAS